jgi:membrane-bound serine protease (ClpP class)
MLIDSPEDYLRIPLSTIIVVVGTTGGLMALVVGAAARSINRQPVTGQEGMIGATGVVKKRIDPTGTVALWGTLWTAQSRTPIDVGATVRVEAVEGLKLTVVPVTPDTETAKGRS